MPITLSRRRRGTWHICHDRVAGPIAERLPELVTGFLRCLASSGTVQGRFCTIVKPMAAVDDDQGEARKEICVL